MGGPAVGGGTAVGQILAGECPITFRPSDLHSLEGGASVQPEHGLQIRLGRWFTRLTQFDSRLCHPSAPSPLAGEGWGEGAMVLVPGGPETPKNPPSPCPSPALGRGEQLREGGAQWLGGRPSGVLKRNRGCRSNCAMDVPGWDPFVPLQPEHDLQG